LIEPLVLILLSRVREDTYLCVKYGTTW